MLSGDDFAAVLKSRERRRSSHFSLHWRSRGAAAADTAGGADCGLADGAAVAAVGAAAVAAAVAAAGTAAGTAVGARNPAALLPRLGLVVPKRLARTSVRRNLIKRQTRMLYQDWSRQSTAVLDVVLKLTANVTRLDRAAQFGELAGLLHALPRA